MYLQDGIIAPSRHSGTSPWAVKKLGFSRQIAAQVLFRSADRVWDWQNDRGRTISVCHHSATIILPTRTWTDAPISKEKRAGEVRSRHRSLVSPALSRPATRNNGPERLRWWISSAARLKPANSTRT